MIITRYDQILQVILTFSYNYFLTISTFVKIYSIYRELIAGYMFDVIGYVDSTFPALVMVFVIVVTIDKISSFLVLDTLSTTITGFYYHGLALLYECENCQIIVELYVDKNLANKFKNIAYLR